MTAASKAPAARRPSYLSYLGANVVVPTAWNPKDKGTFVDVDRSNMEVAYKGSGKDEKDASSIRANAPIPSSCAVFYFEVEVLDKGREGCIGVGLCTDDAPLYRLPGWDPNSYGFHGDDGHIFRHTGKGSPFGPVFGTNDVVGCGLNTLDRTVFYTLNGRHIGIAFRDVKETLYPMTGMRTPGEVVRANFGQRPFMYDIDAHMLAERAALRDTINQTDLSQFAPHAAVRSLVHAYLVHSGYSRTSAALIDPAQAAGPVDPSIKIRQEIRECVVAGSIARAVELTNTHFAGLLDSNLSLYFRLECCGFAEKVRASIGTPTESWLPEVMACGQAVQDKFKNSLTPDELEHLNETFSLLAYPNPLESPVAHLLEQPARAALASKLNSAINVHLKRPASSAFETAMQQLFAVTRVLLENGNASACVADVSGYFYS